MKSIISLFTLLFFIFPKAGFAQERTTSTSPGTLDYNFGDSGKVITVSQLKQGTYY